MEFIFVLATVILGIIALGAIIIGYFGEARLKTVPRLILVMALIGLWWHEQVSSFIGAALLLGIYLYQRFLVRPRDVRSAQQAFSPADPKT
jgi:TRAP-type uncharacterized transport system fused permease subunit